MDIMMLCYLNYDSIIDTNISAESNYNIFKLQRVNRIQNDQKS